jgi:hypothetical protein
MARDSGVIPQSYLSDNGGCFTSAKFTEHLGTLKQVVKFAGVGAHHHNGHAERAIQMIMSIARTMMLHSAVVPHASFLHNHVPNLVSGVCPSDEFSKSRWEQRKNQDLHVWECPVYILEKAVVADGKTLSRWKPRCVCCINMGLSKKHASTVSLVLNPETGYITPQYHIVFDDWFATVARNADALLDFNATHWARLSGDSRHQFPFDEGDNNKATEEAQMDSQATNAINKNQTRVATAMDQAVAVDQLPVSPPAKTQLTAPTPLTPRPPPPTIPLLTPRPQPQECLKQGSNPSIPIFSLLQRQTSETCLCDALLRPARSLRNHGHNTIPELPQLLLHVNLCSSQSGSTPQCLERGRIQCQTRTRLSNQLNFQRHPRHPSLRAAPAAFAQCHNALDTTALKVTFTLHIQVLGSLKKWH